MAPPPRPVTVPRPKSSARGLCRSLAEDPNFRKQITGRPFPGASAAIEAALAIEACARAWSCPRSTTSRTRLWPISRGAQSASPAHEFVLSNSFRLWRHQLLPRLQRSLMRPKPFVPEPLDRPAYVCDRKTGLVWHRCQQRTLFCMWTRTAPRWSITPTICAISRSAGAS